MIRDVLTRQFFKRVTHHAKRFKLITFKGIKRLNTVNTMDTADGKLLFSYTIRTQHFQWGTHCMLWVAFFERAVLFCPTFSIGNRFVAFAFPRLMSREYRSVII